MDRVRFGRALGSGTREAAKALARALEAARAENPAQVPGPARPTPASSPQSAPAGEAQQECRAQTGRRPGWQSAREGLRRGGAQFGAGVFGPVRKASGVLWLEFTGSFFALFALAMGAETWKRRADLRPGVVLDGHAWLAPAMLVVFTYFAVSSFVRAARRGRQ